jgi:broad specificity phosphatase PhoE
VRHAESQRNIWKEIATSKGELVYGGELRDMDVSLTANGKEQAVTTGRRLGVEFKFDRAFVSPFQRTMETAQLMIGQFPYAVEVIEDERLREIDFGVLDGLTKHGSENTITVRRLAKTTPMLRSACTVFLGRSREKLAENPCSLFVTR